MAGGQHVSLEPLPIFANDGKDEDLFAKPARLHDVILQDGSEVYTREDPKKSLQERLMRVWAERGDYSMITEESIRNPSSEDTEGDKAEEDPQGSPSPDDIRKFAETMLNNLTIARGELSTALDLLNVLSPATDPPNVDVNTIPLPHETLSLVTTSVPPPPSFTDPTQNPLAALPLAESLESIKLNAKLFFEASEDLIPLEEGEGVIAPVEVQEGGETSEKEGQTSTPQPATQSTRKRTKAPDPWPTILSLHSLCPTRSLLPLGALPGATLTGKNETRAARQVGVFYGFEEAAKEFRRASVAAIGELVSKDVERGGGRKLCLESIPVGGKGVVERLVWDDRKDVDANETADENDDEDEGAEGILKRRNRSAFAEEMFAKLVKEAKSDTSLGAQYRVGNLIRGESIELKPIGAHQLRISMIPPTSRLSTTTDTTSSSAISLISPLLRLLFLQEYSSRRHWSQSNHNSTSSRTRPLLSTVSALLQYLDRIESLRLVLQRLSFKSEDMGEEGNDIEVKTELWSGERKITVPAQGEDASGRTRLKELSGDLMRVIEGIEPDLGGRASIRLNRRHTFHIFFSLSLPTADASNSTIISSSVTKQQQTTTTSISLRCPGKVEPIAIPSMRHLEDFLKGEIKRVLDKDADRK